MQKKDRSIFRENALKRYMQNGEKTVMPRFISPPIVLSLWCLFGLFVFSTVIILAWRVPVYLNEVGEISMTTQGTSQVPVVVVLLAQSQVAAVHPGMVTQLEVGTSGPQWQQAVTSVNPVLMSPTELRQRYGLDASANLLVTQPAAVALVPVQISPSPGLYIGSIVQVRIQVGDQRLISILSVFSSPGGV